MSETSPKKPLTSLWAEFSVADKTNMCFPLHVVLEGEQIEIAQKDPVASLVGYLLAMAKSPYRISFNKRATAYAYVNVSHETSELRAVHPAEIQAFMTSEASNAERLGPYDGIKGPEDRALLAGKFPALFVAGAEPLGTFSIDCSAS
jgi:hypothetical protein